MSDNKDNSKNKLSDSKLENISGGWAWENRGSRKKILDQNGIKVKRKVFGKDKYFYIDEFTGEKEYVSKKTVDFIVGSENLENNLKWK